MRDTYEKETKVNRRLSMENEELQWRLRQAENSLISGSFSDGKYFIHYTNLKFSYILAYEPFSKGMHNTVNDSS